MKTFKIVVALITAFVVLASPAMAADPRTQTKYATKGTDTVMVYPYVRSDGHGLFVDFESKNFKDVEYVYYNLNYDTDEPQTIRGVEGTIFPTTVSEWKYFNNLPYVRRELVFGTCSRGVCNYERNPRKLSLTVRTKWKNNPTEMTQVLSINN